MSSVFLLSLLGNLAVIVLILLGLFNGKALVTKYVRKYIIDKRHKQIVSMFRTLPIKNGAIIFLGDSITEGVQWQSLFGNANIINRGIGGDTTDGVLRRLDEVTRHQPTKLFLMIGTNDIGFGASTDSIANNYEQILKRILQESPKTTIHAQSVLPVNISPSSPFQHNNLGIMKLNEKIKLLCNELKISHIDLQPAFMDKDGNLKNELSNDGLHLLGAGYEIWKKEIDHLVTECVT